MKLHEILRTMKLRGLGKRKGRY